MDDVPVRPRLGGWFALAVMMSRKARFGALLLIIRGERMK